MGALGDAAVYCRHERERQRLAFAGTDGLTLSRYLGLGEIWESALASFPQDDPHLNAALAHAPGLRVCRQPEWECLATFITSSMKQVTHIRQISLTLRQQFGAERRVHGQRVHAYPSPQRLAEAGEEALRACGLGYRAKGLHRAAQRIATGDFSLDLAGLDDEEARERLCELYGVGEKIADCVLLFAYGRYAAFPIDVWVDRVMRHLYGPRGKRKKWPAREMRAFAWRHFGPFAGYAQQYLFHYARHHGRVLFSGR